MLYRILLILFLIGSLISTSQALDTPEQCSSPASHSCLHLIYKSKDDCQAVLDSCKGFNLALLGALNRLEVVYSKFKYYSSRVESTMISLYWLSQYFLEIHQLKDAEEENDWTHLGFAELRGDTATNCADRILSDIKKVHKRYQDGLIRQAQLESEMETLNALGAYLRHLEDEFEAPFSIEEALTVCLAFRDATPKQKKFYESLRVIFSSLKEVETTLECVA